ncbi:MAG: histidine ammonia-lyase [Chloroflexota bacterium]|nr:MAG: histidine ammonia-lyase [Chloroflexota bacterium]
MHVTVDCSPVSIADVVEVARSGARVDIAPGAVQAMGASRRVVERIVASSEVVYGITTGFGKFADRVIPSEALERLQRNLILSHSVGVGEPLSVDVVRAMMLLRVAALARGYSGIRPETVQTLVDMLNADITPVVPSRGSVGASGDLAPLAHLTLAAIGEGEVVIHGGQHLPSREALIQAGIEPVTLVAKEGLALINGTQLMTAIGCLLVWDAGNLLDVADVVGAMSLEAVRGTNRAFDRLIQEVRPHVGQGISADNLRRLTAGSELMSSHRHDAHKVQDPYSLRCMPQVHGASRDAMAYVRGVIEIEAGSATDNPLIFPEQDEVISGGNFHGQPVALALDFAAIALSEISSISERRVEAMLDPHFSELPPFLTMHAGVESGFMVSQYTAAALVSENKILSHPASVDSIPTSANQEDHVSMGATAALKALQVLRNAETVLAIELLCASEGLDHRRPLRSSEPLEAVHALVRSAIPRLGEDRPLSPDIEKAAAMIHGGDVREAAMYVVAS